MSDRPPFFGYPAFYHATDRTFWQFHVFRMPLGYWLKCLTNWFEIRRLRCWRCGKRFGWREYPDGLWEPGYAAHKACAYDPVDGGCYLPPPVAEALRKFAAERGVTL